MYINSIITYKEWIYENTHATHTGMHARNVAQSRESWCFSNTWTHDTCILWLESKFYICVKYIASQLLRYCLVIDTTLPKVSIWKRNSYCYKTVQSRRCLKDNSIWGVLFIHTGSLWKELEILIRYMFCILFSVKIYIVKRERIGLLFVFSNLIFCIMGVVLH